MTPEAQMIALLEWMGWERDSKRCAFNDKRHLWFNRNDGCCYEKTPPITLDLMYEAEGKLNYDQQYECGEWLRTIILPDCIGKRGAHSVPNGFGIFEVAHATKEQRLEALLKTVGKWVELTAQPPSP